MDQEEMQHLILRQLDDILSQIERILNGDNSLETLENFATFSEELKAFLRKNSTNAMILERIELIPVLNFNTRDKDSILSVAGNILDGNILGERMIRRNVIENIKTAQEYYSSIQYLYKSEIS